MKALHIMMEDEKFKALNKIKGNRTWYGFIDDLIKEGNKDLKKKIKKTDSNPKQKTLGNID